MVTPVSRCGRGSGEGSQKGSGQSQCQRQAVGFRAPPCTWASRAALGTWATWLSPSGILTLLSAALPRRSSLKGRLRHSEKNGSEFFSSLLPQQTQTSRGSSGRKRQSQETKGPFAMDTGAGDSVLFPFGRESPGRVSNPLGSRGSPSLPRPCVGRLGPRLRVRAEERIYFDSRKT